MACYRLCEGYSLRGYKGLPFGIMNPNGRMSFCTKEKYEIVLMCDGVTEIDESNLTEGQKLYLDSLISTGKVEKIETKQPLNDSQNYRLYPAMYKDKVQWSITGRCNYKCKHCLMSAPECKYKEPTKEDCLNVVSQLAECGINTVSITGGEPLVSPYFTDILDACVSHNISITQIFSNGALVNEALVKELKNRNLNPMFQMSFDGIGWHDWLRGVNGAEEKVIDAFRLLKKEGFKTSAAMCLHKHNLTTINETIRLMDSLGVNDLRITIAYPTGLWVNEKEHFLDFDETYQYLLDTAIPQYMDDRLSIAVGFCGLISIDAKNNKIYIPMKKYSGDEQMMSGYACNGVKHNSYISPEGFVLPCMSFVGTSLERSFPNIREVPLRDILSDSVYRETCLLKEKEVIAHNKKCQECKYRFYCGSGCRACSASENNGDYLGIDHDCCRFYKNGWLEKAQNLQDKLIAELGTHPIS